MVAFSAVRAPRAGALVIAVSLGLGALSPLIAAAPASAVPAPAAQLGSAAISAQVPVDPQGKPLGAISSYQQNGASLSLKPATGVVKVSFLDAKTFRIEADPSGVLSDPANTSQNDPARSANLVVGAAQFSAPTVSVSDGGSIVMSTSAVKLEVEKSSGKFTLRKADGTLIWKESAPLSFGSSSATQHLAPTAGEQFLGGGMQNGRSVHTGQTINISKDYNWTDGGNPNAVPYYMSSAGYGVFRNTFAPGSYDFGSAGAGSDETSTHQEKRFDAYYFLGDYKQSLDGYTKLTGRPMMPPIYALEYGDADCYNRSNPDYSSSGFNDPNAPKQHTFDAVKTAEQFKANDMPGAWMLVNDGYGCEYTKDPSPYDPANPGQGLGGTVQAIKKNADLQTGLWTQRSLTQQATEVGQDGIALRKLDVAWVGEGYRMALTGCESAHDGIEQYSANRGVALMVEGWAGSQRCGIQWTGDHTGSLDAIRWQVPALAGSGNSGLAFTTADIDGIFGGSAESYVRDLQWKAFAPALYSMSGWAPVDKRPWLYGDAATAINRQYLQLRQRLMPYIYSLAASSHANGTPMMRTMALEFPQDPASYSAEANNQFMLGSNYLVAPISSSTDIRNGIVLPAGSQWVDYWTGTIYQGGQVLNGYKAPLQTLPLFVRAGALVPQGPVARNASLVSENSALTLDIYPSGNSQFSLYEDDKTSRSYQKGQSSSQDFAVAAPVKNAGDVTVTIGARKGDYSGIAASRPYQLSVHSGSKPASVVKDGVTLTALADKAAFDAAQSGWYYDSSAPGGVVQIKLGSLAKTAASNVVLKGSSAVGGKNSDATAAQLKLSLPAQVFQGAETTATAVFSNSGDQAKGKVSLGIKVPTGWSVKSSTGTSAASVPAGGSVTAKFVVVPGAAAAAGLQTLEASAQYQDSLGASHALSGANQIDVAYGSLAGAYNAVSVTTVAGKASGDFDGGGATFSAEQLATASVPSGGVKPGSKVSVTASDGSTINYNWPTAGPDVNDSVALNGQTIALSGAGTHLAILASAAKGGGVSPELTLIYADGSKQKQSVFFPNWLQPTDLGGGVVAVSSQGRNNANGPSPEYTQYKYQVFSNTLRLIPGKQLAAVTLPVAGNVKFFDWKVVSQKLPAAPDQNVFASDWPWVSATNGYGVIGKDVANKDAANSPDLPLALNYTDPATGQNPTYSKGLGAHAASKITYYLGGQCSAFTADVGLEKGFGGAIIFTVNGDGKQLYQSRTFTPGFAPEHINANLSGVQYLELTLDPANAGAINGAHGVWGNAKFSCSPADTAAPMTKASVSGQPAASGWYLKAPSVSLTATDDVAVATTQYRLTTAGSTSAWNEYTSPFVVSEGAQTLEYRSLDRAGNTEVTQTLTLKVDTSKPQVSAATTGRKLSLSAQDAGSGVASLEYSLDGGKSWKRYSAAIAAGAGGLSALYRATDVAGNIGLAGAAAVIPPVSNSGGNPSIEAASSAQAGRPLAVRLAGFSAGARIELWLHSTPVLLGTVTADASGSAQASLPVPGRTPAGVHTLIASVAGKSVASRVLSVTAAGVLADPSGARPNAVDGAQPGGDSDPGAAASAGSNGSAGSLPATGVEVWALCAVAALLVLAGGTLIYRRRRA
ncbi:NPCBM/NEW2 domain-containing protein [Psychromicrobium sp. YIM B11713]|uniref:NPCBM/NEW2 domain-containing protein n=1 Tax=Psychromicrobium sp. YIM B11713 TaxID=3145233 RepID=UPI00374E9F01